MTVDERIIQLNDEIDELKEKYCGNCQEWNCDYCGYRLEEGEGND